MVPSVIDYLLQLPEAMHFARVQELCGDGVFFYRMLSEYGNGTFQLIEFEDDLLLILIGDYTPKDTFEKITEISEDYMEISQFETDSSSFKIGGRKKNQVDKGIYCYLNTQKKTYTYCEGGKPVRFTKVILSPKYFNTYFRLHDRNNAELLNSARDYILKNPQSAGTQLCVPADTGLSGRGAYAENLSGKQSNGASFSCCERHGAGTKAYFCKAGL